jgi:ribosomal protein S18 acetylase RimI-like enzyme
MAGNSSSGSAKLLRDWLLFSIFLIVCLRHADASFFSTSRPSDPSPPPTATAVFDNASIRIRKTVQADIPAIATMLATAVVREREASSAGSMLKFKRKMDEMFAKADIESLLTGRLRALQEGESAWKKLAGLYELEDQEQMQLFWAKSERLRCLIEKASQETGEDNLWKRHNFVLTPRDMNWFNHVQLTAEDAATGLVVGFLEVAMLSNPTDDTCRTTTVVDDSDEGSLRTFSPGITNLATAPEYRRRGIATRVLQRTERYVRSCWNAERMGLYVEKDNEDAMALYTRLGYTREASCDGGDVLGNVWYMVKDLRASPTELSKSSVKEDSLSVATEG